ncbi:hypothetical protein L226DRAFT_321252 [Lentinus tigrinus ALCF2SS1-7]|uniref:uncharacterized protein n=1 Tax=Lentinus tigrinus ALCF2SS1-7 TaxID=1328758 RepID=UPI001165F9EC|nr:hypothetical protein L226DRAFT_321252 [Lentinus tigrinus ALCF2SS1-7]
MVTFKFMTQHVNMFNEEDAGHGKYKALLDVLLREIRDGHETLRDIASKKCWEHVEMTAEYQQTAARIKTSSSRQSPASAGSSKHPTALDSERVSGSAPPSRTYGSSNTERRQTRQSTRSTRASPTPDLDELILVYPFSGTGAVNITRGDLKRLDPGQYLNDTIIEFGLKVWLDELRRDRPELAEQVHVFNSFFYKKLNAKKNVAETYASVRKWTSKVDIFSKKYIIVPINENFHWYLAIIENPKNMLHPAPPSIKVSAPQTRQTPEAEAEAVPDGGKAKEPSEPPPTHLSGTMTVDGPESEGEVEVENLLHATQSCSIGEPEGDRDCGHDHAPEKKYPMSDDPMDVDASSALGTDDEIEKKPPDRESSEPITVDKLENGKETAAEPTTDAKEPTKGGSADDAEPAAPVAGAPEYPTCYIYTFDSLGSKHAPAGRHLGNYLRHEAVDKKKFPMEDTCMATYKAAKAPMQPNFCDCGVFVLAFVEAFMRNPEASSEAIRRTELSWWDDSQTDLRETFRDRTILLSEEWKKERAAKEGAKEDNIEDNTEEGGKARPNGKARPSPEIVPDSEEDEIEISAVHIPPKPVSRGGKKGSANVAARLRG